jgi:hypothetical protein
MGSKQTMSNTHEHRVLVDTDLQRVTWKEEASNPKPQTSLCPNTKVGNFEGMRRSSPTNATGDRAHPDPLFLELPSQLLDHQLYVPAHSCETSTLSPATPTLPFPPTMFPLITFPFPASLFLRYSQLDKKTSLLRPSFSRWLRRISTVAAVLRTHSTLGSSLLISVFFLCEISPRCEIWKCYAAHSKGFSWKFSKNSPEK